MRDYLLNTFTNSINNTTTTNVFAAGAGIQNRVRLDMLTLDLPPAFLTQTLDRIRVVDNGVNAGFGPNPQRLLVSGITVTATVPEPSTFVLVALATAAAVVSRRKRSRREAPPAHTRTR